MEEQYLKAVRNLHYWQYGQNPTNFTSMLYTMFQKADSCNKFKLAGAFPVEFAVWTEWNEAPTQEDFFAKYGLPTFYSLYSQDGSKSS